MEDARTLLSRKRRRRVLVVVLLVLGIPALLLGGAYLFVQSSAGEALIRKKVLAALGDALAGKLEAGRIELVGNHVVLTDLKLFTPEGELVASLARLEADVDLPGLAAQRLHLSEVKVVTPKLMLKEDERGWNLLRAVAARKAATTPTTASGPIQWRLRFDGVELTDGLLDLEQADRRITATKLAARGSARVRLEPLEVTGTLALSSQLTAPLQEALVATLAASTTQGPQSYDLAVTLGGSRVRGHVELPSVAFTIDELVAAPRELSAFLPAWPVRPVIFGKGSLSPKQAALELSAGRARLAVDAKYDLEKFSAQTLSVRGSDVDLQELVGAPLPSDLAFQASGALSDWRPETLSGSLEAKATWDARNGQRLAEANLEASADKGVVKVGGVNVTSPGLSLRARGTASREDVGAFATLEAKDLSQLAKTLEAFAAVEIPGLAGNGTVRVSLQGPPRGPTATLIGRLNRFSIAGLSAELVEFNADVPDVSAPLDTDIILRAKRLHLGDRAFDDVTFDLITHGREVDLDLATKGLGDLQVHALAVLDKDTRGAQLKLIDLTSTEASWSLEAPTHLDWKDGFGVEPFALRSGDQRVSGELLLTRARLEAKARVEHLDLAKLPRLLAPPSLELAGTLSADAVVTGKPGRPAVTLQAQLRDGKVRGFDALQLSLRGTWLDERAAGTLSLGSSVGSAEGTFDVPVLAFLDEKPGAGTAHFELRGVATRALEQRLGRPFPVGGVLSAVFDLSGSGDHPKVRVTVESDELTVQLGKQAVNAKAAQVSVFTTEAATLEGTLRFSALGAQNDLTLSTPLTIASLRRHLPTPDELLALPVTLQLGVKQLDLKQLDEAQLVHDDELSGLVSLTGTLTGSARAPTGELSVKLENVTAPPLRKANAHFTLRTDVRHTRLTGTATLAEQQQGLELTAALETLPERAIAALLQPRTAGGKEAGDAVVDALADVPLELLLVLQPFALAQAMVTHEGEAPPGGVLSATLEAGGTLQAPTARLVGSLKDLRFDRVALGSARFDLRSTGTEQRFTVALGGEGRDDFKAKGTLGLDLRLSALRHGLDWRAAPIDLQVTSRNFDLGFLSGSTDLLRVVGGRLDLTAQLTGKLGAPRFVGDAEVRSGRLALAGLGDYREVGLELHATDDLVELKRLVASSGAGKAQLVARAERQPSGAFALTSSGTTDRFPIVADDQLQATATLRYSLEGAVTSTLIDIHKLELPRVDVTLPDVKRKDLQDLQRPKDIIVLRAGDRATRRRRQDAKDSTAAGQQAPLMVRVVVVAPRNIWVRSSDLNVEIGLSEGFRVELNDGLRLFGEVRVLKGNIEVIGREFTVQRDSEARFAGPPAQPYVNVSALHVNSREQVKITVTVAGRGTSLGFKVSSEPPMMESDIYAVLATGRRNLKSSGGASFTPGQAASVVGQLAASQLKTVIAKKLPIDVFNFETTDNFEKVKLDVGKYLSDTVYLGGSVDIGAKRERGENVWAGRIELQVTKSISLEAYAGDALSFGADAMWSRDF
ncbi:MAG: translocation/assembly module TamB domain-containing protein [Archangium sp.]|nr:translocation/assembly module TamB domain-containing protein [Archangium sp.]